jgi:hypothetical protein
MHTYIQKSEVKLMGRNRELDTYIHTYIHTFIHTYIHICIQKSKAKLMGKIRELEEKLLAGKLEVCAYLACIHGQIHYSILHTHSHIYI